MKKMLWTVALVFTLSLVGLACPPGYAQEKAIALNFANFFPPENRISLFVNQWCKEVDKRTNGRVKVTHFPGGILTPPAQTYASVMKGVADIGISFIGYTKGRFPLTDLTDLPLGCKDAYWATKMVNAFYKKFKPKEFDDVKLLILFSSPPQIVFTRKPVNNLEDLKGLKIRAGNAQNARCLKAFGAVPVQMPMSEVYDALQKGVIEGCGSPYEPMKGWKFADLVKYSTEFDSRWAGIGYIVMNKEKWNAMPADIQKIIDEFDEESTEKFGIVWKEYDQEAKEYFLQRGGKIITLSKEENALWTERMRPILDEYLKEVKSTGVPAQEGVNFCLNFVKTQQK